MKTVGRHLLAELYGCDDTIINNVEQIRRHMLRAANEIGATVVGEVFHQFSPSGVSGVVVIAESHLSIHTWPETRYVAIDIYTCGGLSPSLGIFHLAGALGAGQCRIQEILRGLPGDLDDQVADCPSDIKLITSMTPVRDLIGVRS
jgi:S-adenosylmethionine decarboxylase